MFRPGLRGHPVVALGNNDGRAIARSNEAQAPGIKMGAPWYQIRSMVASDGLVGLSANFALYCDLSDRKVSLAARLDPAGLALAVRHLATSVGGCVSTR